MKVYKYILTKNSLKEKRFEASEITLTYNSYYLCLKKDYCPGGFINEVSVYFDFYFLKSLNKTQKIKLLKIAKQRNLNENI